MRLNRFVRISAITLLLSIISVPFVGAQVDKQYNPVSTATPFLTISPDARGSAMGDAGVATSADINSQYWNPAKYPFVTEDFGLAFSYTPWLRALVNDIGLFYLVGHKKFGDQTISASMKYFSLGQIDWTDNNGETQGSISPNEFSLDAAYSRLFSEKWSGAVAFRFIHSDLYGNATTDINGSSSQNYPGNSYAADIAIFHTNELKNSSIPITYNFGLNISNIGAKISYDNHLTSEFLPTNFRIGTAWSFQIDDFNKITATMDLNKYLVPTPGFDSLDYERRQNIGVIPALFSSWNDAPGGFKEEMQEVMVSVGTEYAYDNKFFLRGGYFYENAYKGNRKFFTLGAGFEMNVMRLDISYLVPTQAGNPLANTIRFTLGFGVDGLKTLFNSK